jgi:flagellar protein FliO/FliZ
MDSPNIFLLLLRVAVSLGVVIGLMWLAAAAVRRSGMGNGMGLGGNRRRSLPIEVVARHAMGRRSSVALVRTAGKGLVLGITDNQITLLAETDPDDLINFLEEPEAGAPRVGQDGRSASSTWKAVADALREKTARRG